MIAGNNNPGHGKSVARGSERKYNVDCKTVRRRKPLRPGRKTSVTIKILNALKYAASPPANQDEKVRTGVNLAVNRKVAVCNLDECHWEHWVWNHFTPAPAEDVPT